MKKDMRDVLAIAGIVIFALLSCVYYMESIEREVTIMVIHVTKYPNRIFIYSPETAIMIARFPYGYSMDQLFIIEAGNTYKIIYTGFKIISVEVVK